MKKRKKIEKLYLLKTRFDKRYYTEESELVKHLSKIKNSRYSSLTENDKVFVFDIVDESNAIDYVEGRLLENSRDLKMKIILDNDPTSIKIEQVKNYITKCDWKGFHPIIKLDDINFITTEDQLKKWVTRNTRIVFGFNSGDLETDISWFNLILSIHNFNKSSLPARFVRNMDIEKHPFIIVKNSKSLK